METPEIIVEEIADMLEEKIEVTIGICKDCASAQSFLLTGDSYTLVTPIYFCYSIFCIFMFIMNRHLKF